MSKPMFHRHVFYIPGFDPRGASHYHRIYRTEAAKQAQVNGMHMAIGGRYRYSPISQGWNIQTEEHHQTCLTHYECLSWDDIVRAHWSKSYIALLLATFHVIWVYILHGIVFKVARVSRPPLVTGLYPVLFVLLSLLLASVTGIFLWKTVGAVTGALAGSIAGITSIVTIMWIARKLGDKLNVFWLLRIYAFTSQWAQGNIPNMEERMDAFADRINTVLAENNHHEVLVIGHSVGAILAVPVVARALAKAPPNRTLTLLTLGECIPLLSFSPSAHKYREELASMAHTPRLFWADFTSPIDGACFPLVNPVSVSGIILKPNTGPLILSTRFHTLFEQKNYQTIRRNWYRIHFQYLMATDFSGLFDFFAITAGFENLAKRIERHNVTTSVV